MTLHSGEGVEDAARDLTSKWSEFEDLCASHFTSRTTWISPYRLTQSQPQNEAERQSAPSPDENEPPPSKFEYAEHDYIGDGIQVKFEYPKHPGSDEPSGEQIQFHAGSFPIFSIGTGGSMVRLTYGLVGALAGDFYGTTDPISDGTTAEDRHDRFMAAFNTLAHNESDQPADAKGLRDYLDAEIKAVKDAVAAGKDPSEIYKGGDRIIGTAKLIRLTSGRRKANFPGYVGLLNLNWDHFGDAARSAYAAGHAAAIRYAADGQQTVSRLTEAYFMNAFADHFIQDCFSAGHMRTPRRAMHGSIVQGRDLLSNYMHDEECAIGLQVSNGSSSWRAFGDKRLLDKANSANLLHCQLAIQTSADEIYEAWKSRKTIPESDFGAMKTAPVPAPDNEQELVRLFKLGNSGKWDDLERRDSVNDRKKATFTTNWSVAGTMWDIQTGGKWNYPITL